MMTGTVFQESTLPPTFPPEGRGDKASEALAGFHTRREGSQ